MRDRLRSDGVLAAVLILALAAQMPHAAAVFARLAPGAGWLGAAHAAAYALALEGAILIFVMRGRRWTSVGFAACSVAVNLAYYWPAFVAPAALLVSVALPVAIALYSHEMAHRSTDATTETSGATSDELRGLLNEQRATSEREGRALRSLVEELRSELALVTAAPPVTDATSGVQCEDCGASFASSRALGGHRSRCKVRQNGHAGAH